MAPSTNPLRGWLSDSYYFSNTAQECITTMTDHLTTTSGWALRPVRRQVITITREETGGNFNYVVTSGDLLLKFSSLFFSRLQV